jgi:hypothetical protein
MAAIASSCLVSFFKWNKNQVMVPQACARKIFKAILGKSPETITLQDRAFAQSLADAGINATQHMNFLFNWPDGIVRIVLTPGEDLIPEGDLNLVGHLGYDTSSQLLREQKSLYQELKHVEINEAVLKTLHHNFGETFCSYLGVSPRTVTLSVEGKHL